MGISNIKSSSAAVIIAAEDSPHPEHADYVCDGTADQVEIQAAIDEIELGGGADPQLHGKSGATILMLPGRFSTNALITNDKNVLLTGSGFTATEIVLADNSNCGMYRITNYDGTAAVTYGAGMSHIKLNGNITNQVGNWYDLWGIYTSSSDSYFDHVWLNGCGVGIRSSSMWSSYWNQISIEGCTQAAYLNAASSNYMMYLQFIGCNIHQKFEIRAGAAASYASEISIRDCNFGAGTHSYNSLELYGNNYNCLIDNCKFKGEPAAGFYDIKMQENVAGSSQNITVSGCTFPATGGGGNIYMSTLADYCTIKGNRFSHATPIVLQGGATNANGHVYRNTGYVTEKSGTATLLAAGTSIVVTHGLAVTPAAGDIMVTPIETWGNMTKFWIDTYTSTQFTIHADIAPGADTNFAWKAVVL